MEAWLIESQRHFVRQKLFFFPLRSISTKGIIRARLAYVHTAEVSWNYPKCSADSYDFPDFEEERLEITQESLWYGKILVRRVVARRGGFVSTGLGEMLRMKERETERL